ncbi:hypothetical protein SERLA73DRAFT_178111 [Serpula lacrymans var. lacrymans S7.3]|uniref:Uncharacterized protein n=1 Tax=Serpula lacrymans var. lacrymans (strain S7.3) TaxID=936435 RepID=F8PQK8_SERL3|nr:hypothetical protein SERLA73DRAFT_178111 [Serpula lacrymans var. lacrymans S7.3]
MQPAKDPPSAKQAPVRGRVVSSRYLTATTASSRNHTKSSIPVQDNKSTNTRNPASSSLKKSQNVSSISTSKKPATSALGAAPSSAGADPTRRVVSKPVNASTGASSSVSASRSSASTVTVTKKQELPSTASDPLQVAAQLHAWSYMASELDASLYDAKSKASIALGSREKELEAAESDIADQRIRFETERRLQFLDELATDPLARELPPLIQQFLRHGETCKRVTAEALRLGAHGGRNDVCGDQTSPVSRYNDISDQLHCLYIEGVTIERSLVCLLEANSLDAQSLVRPPLTACLALLRARMANITSAGSLVLSCKDNMGLNLQLESLRLHP